MRDARMAILIEDTFARHFLANGYGRPGKAETHPEHERPESTEVIERASHMSGALIRKSTSSKEHLQSAKQRECTICGGQHNSVWCPKRYTTLPPAGLQCKFCKQEGHWWMDCPLPRRRKYEEVDGSRRTRLHGSSTSPSEACPRCGGNHWRSDCLTGLQKTVKPPHLSLYDE
jgi:hypothetical protein